MGYLGTWDQQLAVQESATIHHRSRLLLSAVDTHGGLILLENPSTSMTWDDPLMYEWVRVIAPYGAQASACKFGKDWAKTWMFVSNRPDVFAVACSCDHPSGQHQSIVGARLPDGSYPAQPATLALVCGTLCDCCGRDGLPDCVIPSIASRLQPHSYLGAKETR